MRGLLEGSVKAGERKRIYDHYLTGSFFCGECHFQRGTAGHRMLIQRAVGRNESEYFYFFCAGRQQEMCTSRHLPIQAVEDRYRTVRLQPDLIQWVRDAIHPTLRY